MSFSYWVLNGDRIADKNTVQFGGSIYLLLKMKVKAGIFLVNTRQV